MSKRADDLQTGIIGDATTTLQHYQAIMGVAQCCIFTLDETGVVLTMSPSVIDVVGEAAEAFIGEAFVNWLVDSERDEFSLAHNTLSEPSLTINIALQSASGIVIPCRYTALAQTQTGQFHCFLQALSHPTREEQTEHLSDTVIHMLQMIRDAAYMVDPVGRYIACNREFADWVGLDDPAQVVGKRHKDFLPNEQSTSLVMGDRGTMRAATTDASETQPIFPVIRGMDSVVPISRKAIFDASGRLVGVIGRIQNDFQAEVDSLPRIPQPANRKTAMLEAIPDMMLVLNRAGDVLQHHSSADVQNALATSEVLIATNIAQMGFAPETIEDMLDHLEETIETGDLQSFEFTSSRNADTEHFEVRMVPIDDGEIMMLVRNITPLKRVQDKLRRQINELNILRQVDTELVEWISIDYVVNMSLDAVLRLSHAQSGYLAVLTQDGGMSALSVFGFYDADTLHKMLNRPDSYMRRLMQKQQPQLYLDVNAIHDYERLLDDTAAMIVIPLISRDTMVGVLVVEASKADRFNEDRFDFLRVVTGRIASLLDNARLHRQTEEQLAEMERLYNEVHRLEQLKTDMIRIASHDLKNPLAGIMGYLEMLRWDTEHMFDDQQKEYIVNIDTAARKMQRITTGILSLERIEQMAQANNQKAFDLTELVRKTVDEQRADLKLKKHTLEPTIPSTKIFVKGDPIQMHEVMSNLLSNAIKYTPEKGLIQVSLVIENEVAKVRVKDNGYGIPERMQKRLFTPFYRAKTLETKSIEGNGLGLHLVKNIIERHNGELFFESVYNEGSTFGFDLPTVEEPEITLEDMGSMIVGARRDDSIGGVTGSTVVG